MRTSRFALCELRPTTLSILSRMDDDWRLRGQEDYLQGATLLLKAYRAWSVDWEHDHCEFCWAKFMDPTFSPEDARFIAENPEVLTGDTRFKAVVLMRRMGH